MKTNLKTKNINQFYLGSCLVSSNTWNWWLKEKKLLKSKWTGICQGFIPYPFYIENCILIVFIKVIKKKKKYLGYTNMLLVSGKITIETKYILMPHVPSKFVSFILNFRGKNNVSLWVIFTSVCANSPLQGHSRNKIIQNDTRHLENDAKSIH